MQNDVLTRLHADHARFERLFRVIEDEGARLELGHAVDMPRLKSFVTYFSHEFARHHGLEDAIFAELLKCRPQFREEIFDLFEDHQVSQAEFKRLSDAIDRGNGDLAETIRSFVANERGHFISEEETLLRYAAQYLTEEQWCAMRGRMSADDALTPWPDGLEIITGLLGD